MAGIQFGNVGGGVTIGTMAGRDLIQNSTLHEKDKVHLEELSRQLEATVDEKKDGWKETAGTLAKEMFRIGKDVAVKVVIGILTKRIGG